jgi:hypothetical protein
MFNAPVIGVWPSAATDCVKAAAMSESEVLAQLEVIVVPVTTGLPAGSVYVPDPFLLILVLPL